MAKDKNQDADFAEKFVELISASINCVTMGKVVRYADGEADVQPLPLQSDGDKRAMLLNCPVVITAQHWYDTVDDKDGQAMDIGKINKLHAGNIVVVVFNDRDTDNYSGGEFSLASRRMHNVNDGIVVGVLK